MARYIFQEFPKWIDDVLRHKDGPSMWMVMQ
jgi:hypothetical protein